MTKNFPLLRLSLVLGLGLAVAGCDTVSNAADSVGNAVSNVYSDINPFSDDAPVQTADNDAPPMASSDTEASTSPDLANLPSRPTTSTPAQQQAAAQSLAADGAQARYSADALRAGTEAAAAPPSAADVPPSARVAVNAPPSANNAPPDAAPSAQAPSAQAPVAQAPAAQAPASPPSAALAQGTGAVPTAGAPTSGNLAPVRTAALPPTSNAAAIPPGAEPAVPANAPVRRGSAMAMGNQYASDSALGFKPSSAPPLDPSINKWVAAPVVARYRQTASNAGVSSASSMAAVPPRGTPINEDGAVMANMGAVSTSPVGSIAAMNGGVSPTAVIYFPGDGSTLSPAARTQIRNAVAQYKSSGGDASVRVVGHASSRTANMPVEKHLEVIFDKSQARANAVAQELIREGVPAAKVLVDAVGDSQPVYYESMPQGEDGNRRAEIFVQG